MIRNAGFFEKERESPILMRDEGYIERVGIEQVIKRVSHWPALLGLDKQEQKPIVWRKESEASAEILRIVQADAVRSFLTPEDRATMTKVLLYVSSRTNDYQQGMGYVCSFLLLFFDDETVARMLLQLYEDPKYIKGYWKAVAVECAIDANLFQDIMLSKQPQHPGFESFVKVSSSLPYPETYLVKWFSGLCVHFLPFESLVSFLDSFFAQGFRFLFKFANSAFEILKSDLINEKNQGKLLETLRFERVSQAKIESMLTLANTITLDEIDWDSKRKEVYEKKLKQRIESSRAASQKKQTSDDEDDDDDDDDDEEGLVCMTCDDDMVPEYHCKECNVLLCETCHKKEVKKHKKTHKVVPADEIDDIDELAAKIKKLQVA
eukprot:TRINITY_DN1814_c0_g1_i1.p1 TRINITY_DN1814_c0_g1~~TRINITY_DN1814_c0_g1_i1.p1  ORF type:complete len:378 (+),score=101.65 TRINITY_DN1814_c0_g1_i1:145-1278(+)